MSEIWKDIIGFEERYMISNKGNVYDKKRKVNSKLNKKFDGYILCTLRNGDKYYTKQVHRLVAIAFIPNPQNKSQVHHIDENPSNNNVHNLMWVTPKEHGSLRSEESKRKFKETYLRNKELREKKFGKTKRAQKNAH